MKKKNHPHYLPHLTRRRPLLTSDHEYIISYVITGNAKKKYKTRLVGRRVRCPRRVRTAMRISRDRPSLTRERYTIIIVILLYSDTVGSARCKLISQSVMKKKKKIAKHYNRPNSNDNNICYAIQDRDHS